MAVLKMVSGVSVTGGSMSPSRIAWRLQYFIVMIFIMSVSAQSPWDVQLRCPAGKWTERSDVTLTCTLLKASFPSKCSFFYTETLQFSQTDISGFSSVMCTVSNFTNCGPFAQSQNGCRCAQNNPSNYSFEYKFTGDKSHNGSRWECYATCYGPGFTEVQIRDTVDCNVTVQGLCDTDKCINGVCSKSEHASDGYICSCRAGSFGKTCAPNNANLTKRCKSGELHLMEDQQICDCPRFCQGDTCNDLSDEGRVLCICVVLPLPLLVLIIWQVFGCVKGRTTCTVCCTTSKQACCCCLKDKRAYCLARSSNNECHFFYSELRPDYPSDDPNSSGAGKAIAMSSPPAATGVRGKTNKDNDSTETKNNEKHVPVRQGGNKHTGTEKSPSKTTTAKPAADLTVVREKSASVSSADDSQEPNSVHHRPLPHPAGSRLPSVERNSTIDYSSPRPDPLPPIKK